MSGEDKTRKTWLSDRRVIAAGFGAGAALLLGGSGLAVASAVTHPEPASAGRQMSFEYATIRSPRYQPPPPTEGTRLDVRPPATLYEHIEVLAPEADAAWTAMQADDARRMATALAEVRASDRRLDRELTTQLRESRSGYERQRPAEFVQVVERDDDGPADEG